jgi:uncharacterized protein
MTPFYFRPGEASLFGCFHPCDVESRRSRSILLCHAWGHEYMASHRAMRQLAARLAQSGWPALRFDWLGSGDSGGGSDRATLTDWQLDVGDAAAELTQRSRDAQQTMIGLRLGASIALLHTQRLNNVHSLVLWDPIVSGQAWLDDVVQQQDAREEHDLSEVRDICGVPLHSRLSSQLAEMNLLSVTRLPARHVLVIDAPTPREDTAALVDHLQQLGSIVERRSLTYPPGWLEAGTSVVPGNIIQSVVGWLKDVEP